MPDIMLRASTEALGIGPVSLRITPRMEPPSCSIAMDPIRNSVNNNTKYFSHRGMNHLRGTRARRLEPVCLQSSCAAELPISAHREHKHFDDLPRAPPAE